MEEKTKEDNLATQTNILLEAKTGKSMEPEKYETPLEEARRLNRETKENMQKMTNLSKQLQRQMEDLAIGGRSFAGQPEEKPKDPLELERERAKSVVDKFLNRR